MNRIQTNLLSALVVIIVAFFLGRLMFLSNISKEIEQAKNRLQTSQQQLSLLTAQLEKSKSDKKTTTDSPRNQKLLKPGQESSLLRLISEVSEKSFKINSFELLGAFMFKPAEAENMEQNSQSFKALEELPQLDEQGMPVGLSDETDEEWPGVEIIPVKVTFASTYRTLGKFLSEAKKQLPLHAIRSMDILMKTGGIVRGTLVMTFPVSERHK